MKRFFFDCGTRDALASTGILFLRVSFGLMMLIGHGIGKWQAFSELAGTWPVPRIWPLSMMSGPVSLIATIGAEVVAALLLVLGLATRPAAFVFGFAMVVAAFQVNVNADFFATGAGPAKEMAVLYLIPCFVLIITGGGQWSADALFNTEDRRRRRR